MWEIKTVLIIAALLLAANGFCIYQVNSDKKWDTIAESKMKILVKKSTKSFV